MSNPPAKLLLVDDLEANLVALDALLRREDLELLHAHSGQEALELLLGHEVALALVDVQMPGMDGFELAELMRGSARTRNVPIIFLTAGAVDKERRFRGYEAGAVDFLHKPIEPDILRSKVNIFLELYRQSREIAWQRDEMRAVAEENARLLRERTESELRTRESEALFRSTFETAAVGMAHVGLNGRWLRCNDTFCQITGYSREELAGKTFTDITHPDDLGPDLANVERMLRGEARSFSMEKRYIRKDGSTVWVHVNATLLRNSAGAPQYFIGVVQDIDARKSAEAESDRQRGILEAILTACPAGIIMADANGKLLRVNPANEKLWGPAPLSNSVDEYVEYKGWWADESPHKGERIQPREWAMARALRGEPATGDVVEIEPFDAPGTRRIMINSGATVRDQGGKIIGAVVAQIDVTDIKRAEAALRESEERFRALAENIPQLAWMTDEKGWVFWYNQRWYDFTGTNLEQMQGWGWQRVHHPEHLDRVTERWKAALASGQPWQDTFPLRDREGNFRWFLSRAFPIRNAEGKITRWFGTNTDITELRQTQEELRQAQGQLQQHAANLGRIVEERTARLREMVAELEAFSYSIVHDMRAPLRSMLGFSKVLIEEYGGQLDETARNYLNRIAASASRMDQLIVDVLNYSKVMRGQADLRTVDITALLDQIIETYPVFREGGSEILIQQSIPAVAGNDAMLTQVFSNLLANAVKFVAPGLPPRVRVWAERRESRVRIFVQDNGIGIDPGQQQKIFEMFQRVDKSYEGTGIGLAIVQKAMQRMGGSVGVESALGHGSSFWVDLAAAD